MLTTIMSLNGPSHKYTLMYRNKLLMQAPYHGKIKLILETYWLEPILAMPQRLDVKASNT